MRKTLVITDLTRMHEGRVCVAGYDEEGACIRPVLPPPGILEQSLYADGKPAVFPSAVVEYDLLEHRPQPPHTEDWRYDPASVQFVERLKGKQMHETLTRALSQSVAAIFEQPILTGPGFYVMDGQGPRSLGTVRAFQPEARYEQRDEGRWEYRLRFDDHAGHSYSLGVTDLSWRYYCDHQRNQRRSPSDIAAELNAVLQSAEEIYLRIGLARGWEKFPDRCYLQIIGVYAFPGYLRGRTFADFAPQ